MPRKTPSPPPPVSLAIPRFNEAAARCRGKLKTGVLLPARRLLQ